MSRRNSRAQRQIACMPCQAVEIEKRHGKIRADTGFIQGMAHAEVYEVQRLFEGLCPTHRNTYRLMRDAIDKQADAETTNAQALDLAIAKAAEEGRRGS